MFQSMRQWFSPNQHRARAERGGFDPSLLPALDKGWVVRFATSSFLGEDDGEWRVSHVSTYEFGTQRIPSYTLVQKDKGRIFFTPARDEQGYYLALSRELSPLEVERWFDPDVFGFFSTPSSARTLKARPTITDFGAWMAPIYSKTIGFEAGEVFEGKPNAKNLLTHPRKIKYSLLMNEQAARAIEIERFSDGSIRVLATVYRPLTEITEIYKGEPEVRPKVMSQASVAAPRPESVPENKVVEFSHVVSKADMERKPAPKNDFRRKPNAQAKRHFVEEFEQLPSFLRHDGLPIEEPDDFEEYPAVEAHQAEKLPHVRKEPLANLPDNRPSATPVSRGLNTTNLRCSRALAANILRTSLEDNITLSEAFSRVLGEEVTVGAHVYFHAALDDEDYVRLAARFGLANADPDTIHQHLLEVMALHYSRDDV